MNEREYRVLAEQEIRQGDDGVTKIIGYAAVFDKPAEIYGFQEVIRKGAFLESIEQDDVRALIDHDSGKVLGKVSAGNVILYEDDIGLRYEVILKGQSYANDLLINVNEGIVSGSSFGFVVEKEKWSWRDDGPDLREILKAKLFDVSPVTFPAYEETDVSVALRNAPEEVKARLLPTYSQVANQVDKDKELEQVRRRNDKLRKQII